MPCSWHPHRGFSTISYIIQGESAHQDSMGNSGILRAGDVQWMKAGSGIVHDEMPTEAFKRKGGVSEGFQIWVNLPAAQKMTPPSYQDVACDDIPTVPLPDNADQIKVIAGSARGVEGATQHEQEIHYVDIHLNAGHSTVHAMPEGLVGWMYVYRGEVAVGTHRAKEGQLLLLAPEGTDIDIASVGTEQAKAIVLAAAPIDEPVARRGPFVMNTDAEVMQAFNDYRDGTLASVPAQFLHRTGHE